jgi:hypothetical protein
MKAKRWSAKKRAAMSSSTGLSPCLLPFIFLPHIFLPWVRSGSSFCPAQSDEGKKMEGKNKAAIISNTGLSPPFIFLPHIFLPGVRSGSSLCPAQTHEGKKMEGKKRAAISSSTGLTPPLHFSASHFSAWSPVRFIPHCLESGKSRADQRILLLFSLRAVRIR